MQRADPLRVLDATYRAGSRRVFAQLVRALGDFDVAEDALQDAVRAASTQWRDQGIPENPEGWLFRVAKNRGISILRQRRRQCPLTEHEQGAQAEPHEVGDELLRLVFLCCHPAISPDAQVALTLREVCELTTEEIAAAYLTPTPTIAQRIVRAKAKIRDAAIPFDLPCADELPERLPAVLKTIYLVFNESYASSSGSALLRQDLMSLSVHLGRQLFSLIPEPEVGGLLALMLIHQARSATRTTPEGDLILLEHQDRSQWDRNLLAEAGQLVAQSLGSGRFGAYTVQAAIASIYADAPRYEDTDWNEIIGLYDVLARIEPSPVVMLNRAVAIAMRDGPEAGIAWINRLLDAGVLTDYHRAFAARGELHWRNHDAPRARKDFERALELARQEPERRYLLRRISESSDGDVDFAKSEATSLHGSLKGAFKETPDHG